MQVATDATTYDGGFEHVALCLRIRDSRGTTSGLSLGTALAESKTAVGEVAALDERLLSRLRIWLQKWRDVHIKVFGEDDEGLKCIPDPAGLNWHRVAKGGSAMSDACNQAQAMSKVIEARVREEYAKAIGVPVGELDETDVEFFRTFCHNHLRNTAAKRAVKFEAAFLAPKFAESKERLPARLRVNGDVSAAMCASSKEFVFLRPRGYAKGVGLEFFSWALEHAKGQYIFMLERFDLGTRYALAMPLFFPFFSSHQISCRKVRYRV